MTFLKLFSNLTVSYLMKLRIPQSNAYYKLTIFLTLLLNFFVIYVVSAIDSPQYLKSIIKKNDVIAIVGDSITGQKIYSKFIEAYLLACRPDLNLRVVQMGLPGDEAASFVGRRMEADLIPLEPDVTTICYGMNDGHYNVYRSDIGKRYDDAMRKIVLSLKEKNKTVIIGTPPCVDSNTFNSSNKARIAADIYNETLRRLGDLDKKIAEDFSMPVADIHSVMGETMKKAKLSYGGSYHVAGADGIHPSQNGHLVIAYTFLKAMGFDGNIGTVTIDLKSGKASAEGGHVIKSSKGGKIEVTSARYPFCFYGQDKDPNGTISILPYISFNRDLNRFTLIVKNCPSTKSEVKWGPDKKVFEAKKLEEGINLADEFLSNPFSDRFNQFLNIIDIKQQYETSMTGMMATLIKEFGADKDIQTATASIREKIERKRSALQKDTTAFVTPLTHYIEITPIK